VAKDPSRKWALHSEWCYERQGLSFKALARKLRTGRKTLNAWDVGTRPVPHWAPQVLRLQRIESASYLRQLGRPDPRNDSAARTGLVSVNDVRLLPASNEAVAGRVSDAAVADLCPPLLCLFRRVFGASWCCGRSQGAGSCHPGYLGAAGVARVARSAAPTCFYNT